MKYIFYYAATWIIFNLLAGCTSTNVANCASSVAVDVLFSLASSE